jgi:hypothetical protein
MAEMGPGLRQEDEKGHPSESSECVGTLEDNIGIALTARDAAARRCRFGIPPAGASALAEPPDGGPEGITGSEQPHRQRAISGLDIWCAANRLIRRRGARAGGRAP